MARRFSDSSIGGVVVSGSTFPSRSTQSSLAPCCCPRRRPGRGHDGDVTSRFDGPATGRVAGRSSVAFPATLSLGQTVVVRPAAAAEAELEDGGGPDSVFDGRLRVCDD